MTYFSRRLYLIQNLRTINENGTISVDVIKNSILVCKHDQTKEVAGLYSLRNASNIYRLKLLANWHEPLGIYAGIIPIPSYKYGHG